jgi:hypothetical protein
MFTGVREQAASVTHYMVDLIASEASMTYTLPSPDGGLGAFYADDFDSLEGEIQCTDEPMACLFMSDPDAKKVRQDVMLGVKQASKQATSRWTAMSISMTPPYERHPIDFAFARKL